MPPERFAPDDAREWLRAARGDLALAGVNAPNIPWELLCFHAQQAAEKAMKAVLLHRKTRFPHVHDLSALLDLLSQSGGRLPSNADDVARLTAFAVLTRYPFVGEIAEQDYRNALAVAERVVEWAQQEIQPPHRK
jgi:HEPN domain-containing protein